MAVWFALVCTVEPLHRGHCWGMDIWLIYGGGCCGGVLLYSNTLDQGCCPLYRRWLLLRGDRYEGFHCMCICMFVGLSGLNPASWSGRVILEHWGFIMHLRQLWKIAVSAVKLTSFICLNEWIFLCFALVLSQSAELLSSRVHTWNMWCY